MQGTILRSTCQEEGELFLPGVQPESDVTLRIAWTLTKLEPSRCKGNVWKLKNRSRLVFLLC